MFWRRKPKHVHTWEYFNHRHLNPRLVGWRYKVCRSCGKTEAY